ncbi:MAG: gliding motility-associated C-terminal domain-containing protein [Chitinophagaceae bacterium]|nr:gliding motility-associated C-terminal domain-containing protein [Chitinophagaceae bacterium]
MLALSGVPFSQNIFSFVNNETCPGANNGSINLFTGGTSAPYTYSWNTTPVQTTANATNLDSGIYVCKITDINGCITYDTVSVLLMPVIPLNTLANPPVICEGASTQLTVAGLSAFSWSPGGQTTSPAIVSPVVTTDYIVSGNDANGCTRQDTVTVTVNPLPVIIVNPNPASICTGGNIVLQASGASAYSWSPSTGLSNTAIFNPVANPADTTVYTVTGIDANGCSNSATVEVAVKPSPLVVAAANPSTICQGASSDLSVSGLNSFTWYPGGQTISPIIVSPLVTTIYTVTGSGSNGCNGQGTVTVTVNTLPIINCAPASTAICKSDSVLLTANGGVSYSWSPATDLNDPAVSNPFASPTTTTIYTVTGFDANGCSSTATSVVTVYNAPSVIAVADPSSICEGSSTQLSVSGLSLFNWNPGGQTISPITVSPNGSTTYTISGTDVNGCSGEGTVTVTVAPNPVVAVTSTDTIICNGTQATLIASGTATQYIWTPGAITGSMVSVSPSDTTEYMLTGVLGNCTAIDSITINVVPSPDVAFFPSLLEGCDPLLVSFTDQSLNGTEWSWLFGDGGSAAVQNPEHVFHPGTWSITETVSNEAGCTSTLVLPELIQVYADPVADFTVNPAFYQPVELINAEFQFLNQSIGATDFFWDFADEVFSDEEDPLHRYIAPGDYAVTLIVTGPGNCSDTISKSFLTVIPSTIGFIPTAFTPNGDGLNDLFLPTNTNLVGMDMKIFNRWGNLIFHGTSPADGWNGTYQDLPAEIGVYVYSISLQFENGKQEVRKGNLTLVR